MAKKKKTPLTSDGIYTLDDWSMGSLNTGNLTETATISYDLGQLDFDYDKDL